MRKQRVLVLVMAFLLTAVLAGCGSGSGGSSDSKGEIVIASANPMSGDVAQYGDTKVKGIQIAIDEVNAKGGIGGRKVRLEVGDDAGNPKEGANLAQKLASNSSISAVIGHWNSSVTLAAIPIYDKAGLPAITDSVNRKISGASKYVFRIFATDIVEGRELAAYTKNILGKSKAAIIYENNDYGQGLTASFTENFKKLGGEVVASEPYIGGTKDFKPQISKIKGLSPDVLFIGGYHTETALIARQAREAKMDLQLLAGDGVESEDLMKLGGQAVEGLIFAADYNALLDIPGNKEFVEKFKAKYGRLPDTYAALAYDSARLILEGMTKNGVSRDKIQQYLKQVKDFPGVTGKVTFNDQNDAERPIYMLVVKGGKIVPAEKQLK